MTHTNSERDRKRREILKNFICNHDPDDCDVYCEKQRICNKEVDQALTALKELDRVGREEMIEMVWNNFLVSEKSREGAKLNKIMCANIERVSDAIIKFLEER